MIAIRVSTVLLALIAAPAVAATLDAKAAQAIVAGCASHAATQKQSYAVAVVDLGGQVVASLRMDGNPWGIMDLAVAKARAAAAWGDTTAALATGAAANPGFAAIPNVVIIPGGVPLWSADGRERIGAVGVSGQAPADDVTCATAGVAAAGLRVARVR